MISLTNDSDKSPEAGGDTHPFNAKAGVRQLALERYRFLESVPESELTFSDKLFMENFEAAVYFWWRAKFFNR
jgi:hypothetical protein